MRAKKNKKSHHGNANGLLDSSVVASKVPDEPLSSLLPPQSRQSACRPPSLPTSHPESLNSAAKSPPQEFLRGMLSRGAQAHQP